MSRIRKEVAGGDVVDYAFDGWDGPTSLGALFQGKSSLIVIHNMGGGCRYCSMWADGIAPLLPQLEQVAAVAMINHDPVAEQRATAAQRGWPFVMASAANSGFTADMGFTEPGDGSLRPGTSTFTRAGDGTIRRNDFAYFGPHDKFCATYSFLELLPEEAVKSFEPLGVS